MAEKKEKLIELECDYCGRTIEEKDFKCPNCGADCSSKIKKYKKQKEELEEAKKKEQMEYSKKVADDLGNAMVAPVKVIFVIAFVMILFITIMIITGIRNTRSMVEDTEDQNEVVDVVEEQKIVVGYNELADGKEFSIILDSYEYYEYVSDNFPSSYNTPDGYQKIAFHFVVENKTKRDDYISASDIHLKADDYAVESANLSTGVFERAVVGQSDYPALQGNYVEAGEKIKGYVGYLIPKDKKTLKFSFEGMTIQMDNPVYEGE